MRAESDGAMTEVPVPNKSADQQTSSMGGLSRKIFEFLEVYRLPKPPESPTLPVSHKIELDEEELKRRFPSIEDLYPLAVSSYSLILNRIDLMNQRLQFQAGFVLSMIGALAVFLKVQEIPFSSFFFIVAMILMGFSVFCAIWPQVTCKTQQFNASKLKPLYLSSEPLAFKLNLIGHASDDEAHNRRVLERQHRWLVTSLVVFSAAAALVLVWASVSADQSG